MSNDEEADPPAIDQAQQDFLLSIADDAEEQRTTARTYLAAVAHHGAAVDREEAIELITNQTEWNKNTVRDWYDEVRTDQSRRMIEIHRITKVYRYDDEDPIRYRIELTAGGERGEVVLDSDELLSQKTFRQAVLELTDTIVEFDEWTDTVNRWLEQAPIERDHEEPIGVEHAAAESVVDRIGALEPTRDHAEFNAQMRRRVLVDEAAGEALVPSQVVDKAASGEVDVSRRKLRAVLDPLLSGNSKVLRTDDTMTRVWRFDLERLVDGGVIDLDALPDPDDETADEEPDATDETTDDSDTDSHE